MIRQCFSALFLFAMALCFAGAQAQTLPLCRDAFRNPVTAWLLPRHFNPTALERELALWSLSELSPEALAQTRELYDNTGRLDLIVELIKGAQPSGVLTDRLAWQNLIVAKAMDRSLTLDEILHFGPLTHAQKHWDALAAQGWKAELTFRRSDEGQVTFDESAKVMRISLSASYTPLPLLLSAHIHFLALQRQMVSTGLDKEVKVQIARIVDTFAPGYSRRNRAGAIDEDYSYLLARHVVRRMILQYPEFASLYPVFRNQNLRYLSGAMEPSQIDSFLKLTFRELSPAQRRARIIELAWGISPFTRQEKAFLPIRNDLSFFSLAMGSARKPERLKALLEIALPNWEDLIDAQLDGR